MELWAEMGQLLLPILIAILPVTVLVMAAAGRTTQALTARNKKRRPTMTELLNDFLTGSVAWGVLLTLAAFGLGVLINRVTGKAIFNPLLLGSILSSFSVGVQYPLRGLQDQRRAGKLSAAARHGGAGHPAV